MFERLIEEVKKDKDVIAVYLFGSYARGESHRDIDICLVLKPVRKKYSKIFLSEKKLKYLKNFEYDIQIFQQLPLYIRHRVLKEGKLLYSKGDEIYDVAFLTIKEYEDFKPIYESYLEEVMNG